MRPVRRSEPAGSPRRSARSASRARAACASFAAALALCAACSDARGSKSSHDALAELEQLGFVPMGSAQSGSTYVAVGEPLLVGMYEVTRAEFRRYAAEAAPELDPLLVQRLSAWLDSDDALPMSFVTREEAAAYARWAGLRLPTRQEWLFCALSPRALAYPWSDSWQEGRANTFELERRPPSPTRVGTFEGGRTETHLYDMLGNVWEWAAGEPGGDSSALALGGSYRSYKREIHSRGIFFSDPVAPGSRFEDLGFRVCAPARNWLEAHAGALGAASGARARLFAVGRRWGAVAEPLLVELAAASSEKSARASLEAILAGARG